MSKIFLNKDFAQGREVIQKSLTLDSGRDSKLRGTCLFSSSILNFFKYACRTVRLDFRLPIGIYIDKHVYSAIIVVMF